MAGGVTILFEAVLDEKGVVSGLKRVEQAAGQASQTMGQQGGMLGQLASGWQSLVVGMGAYIGGRALISFIKESIQGAIEQEVSMRKLEAALEATGHSAGFTAEQIDELAQSMMDVGDVTDDEVRAAATLLSTFKEVRGQGFTETIKVGRDLAAMMGTDLVDATRLLGKVQQDPIQGMTMMRRAGIVLTDAEKALIKTTTEHSGAAAGQAAILATVKARVEGVADAMANTLQGRLKAVTIQWGEFKEVLGAVMIKIIDLKGVTEFWTQALKNVRAELEKTGSAFPKAFAGMNLLQLQQQGAMLEMSIKANREAAHALYEKAQAEGASTAAGLADMEQHNKLLSMNTAYRTKLAEVSEAIKEQTKLQTASDIAKAQAKALTEDEANAYKALTDAMLPLNKARQDQIANIALARKAQEAGDATHAQTFVLISAINKKYAEEVDAITKMTKGQTDLQAKMRERIGLEMRLAELRLDESTASEQYIESFTENYVALIEQQYAMTKAVEGELAATVERIEAYKKLNDTLKAVGESMKLPKMLPFTLDVTLEPKKVEAALTGMAEWAQETLSKSIADGIMAGLQSGKVTDAYKLFANAFAGFAAGQLGTAITALFETDKNKQKAMLIASGLAEGQVDKVTGAVTEFGIKWESVAATVGGILGAIGQARQNRGLATLGGAVSGAVVGGSIGGATATGIAWGSYGGIIGMAIGAFVGAALAYFGSAGASKESARLGLRGGRGYVTEITGGVDVEAERAVAEKITLRYRTVAMAFRESLQALGAAMGDMPDVTLAFYENSKNLQSAIDAFISGTVPRAVFEKMKPALEAALGSVSIGVSKERIEELMKSFVAGDFDKALAAFQAYVVALIQLQDLSKELGKDLETLRDDVSLTMRETFMKSMADGLEQIGKLSEGIDTMTSEEQVARANQIGQLASQQYQAALQWLQQINQLQQAMNTSFEQTFFGFREQEAQAAGPEAEKSFYLAELERLKPLLAGATSTEEIQKYTQMMLNAGTALWKLGGELPSMFGGGPATKDYVEQFLKEQQAVANTLLDAMAVEAKAQLDLYKAAVDAVILALQSATFEFQKVPEIIGPIKDPIDDMAKGLGNATSNVLAFSAAVGGAAYALGDRGGGLNNVLNFPGEMDEATRLRMDALMETSKEKAARLQEMGEAEIAARARAIDAANAEAESRMQAAASAEALATAADDAAGALANMTASTPSRWS